jgi:CRP/FNR family transcriptional regulator, dissimilatory nitrate respiration regulator
MDLRRLQWNAGAVIEAFAPCRFELARGKHLFRQGDPAAAIFRVARGRLRLERLTLDGRRVILHTARTGELFAEASLFASTYHCNAMALTDREVEVLPKGGVLAALGPAGEPGGLVETLTRQLQAARTRLELRNVRLARDRILLWLDLQAGTDRVATVEGELQDVAAELGLTREAFYRTLASLDRDGLIAREGTRIRLGRRVNA